MPRHLLAGLVVVALATGIASAEAETTGSLHESTLDLSDRTHVPIGAPTTRPIGHVEFCHRHPDECGAVDELVAAVEVTEGLLNELVAVNDRVNASIRAVTDWEFHQVEELWSYPGEAGDCEDFVLAKRKELFEAGWPLSTLLITVVRQDDGAGHAVLMVRTSRGDYVLDNLHAGIRLWKETPYTYLKRQSQEHAGRWVTIGDDRSVVTVAGTNAGVADPAP